MGHITAFAMACILFSVLELLRIIDSIEGIVPTIDIPSLGQLGLRANRSIVMGSAIRQNVMVADQAYTQRIGQQVKILLTNYLSR